MLANKQNINEAVIMTVSFILFFLSSSLFSETPEKAYNKIIENKDLVMSASQKFDINPVFLSAIIYTERTRNYDWTDEAFDEVIARVGQNSSIGFGQIKIKTAYFIEKQISDSTSKFYCGKFYKDNLKISKTPFQLIEKLQNDSLNILYAAAYIRIIQTIWENRGFSINDNPEIIGSLYQLGLFHPNGLLREPHFNPEANEFGKMVKESVELFNIFQNKPIFNIIIE